MTQSFEQLKRNRQDSFSKLTEQLEKLNEKKSYAKDDENYWKPEVDKAGNGFAVIRFLPAPQGEDVPIFVEGKANKNTISFTNGKFLELGVKGNATGYTAVSKGLLTNWYSIAPKEFHSPNSLKRG